MSFIAILGRQPEIGVAELESVFGSSAVTRVFANTFVELDIKYDRLTANRLGGTLKLCQVLTTLDTTNWLEIEKYLIRTTADNQQHVPEGRLTIGLSTYGYNVSCQQLGRTALNIKKAVKHTDRSVRLVPNTEPIMNSAQVLHNDLTGERGWDLCLIRDNGRTILAQTFWSQDIDAYAKRDQARPARDARVGMLPPKLAQIIVNLAVGSDIHLLQAGEDRELRTKNAPTILDPFCGTGVVLQEALLMGFNAYGTDLEPRMIEYSQKNMDWLLTRFPQLPMPLLETADATDHKWQNTDEISAVACESYLGSAFASLPTRDRLEEARTNCNMIIKKFLMNLAAQTKPGFRACVAVPAWQFRDEILHLPLIDSLEKLGYTTQDFKHVANQKLIYQRSDQIVGRELLVLIRK